MSCRWEVQGSVGREALFPRCTPGGIRLTRKRLDPVSFDPATPPGTRLNNSGKPLSATTAAAAAFSPPAGAAAAVSPSGTAAATTASTTRNSIYAFTATGGRLRTCASLRLQAGREPPVAQESGSLAHPSGLSCHCTSTGLGNGARWGLHAVHLDPVSEQVVGDLRQGTPGGHPMGQSESARCRHHRGSSIVFVYSRTERPLLLLVVAARQAWAGKTAVDNPQGLQQTQREVWAVYCRPGASVTRVPHPSSHSAP